MNKKLTLRLILIIGLLIQPSTSLSNLNETLTQPSFFSKKTLTTIIDFYKTKQTLPAILAFALVCGSFYIPKRLLTEQERITILIHAIIFIPICLILIVNDSYDLCLKLISEYKKDIANHFQKKSIAQKNLLLQYKKQ